VATPRGGSIRRHGLPEDGTQRPSRGGTPATAEVPTTTGTLRMIVEPAGLPNVPFADLSPALSPFRPELSGVGSRIEHMSERVLEWSSGRRSTVPGRAWSRCPLPWSTPWIDPDRRPRLGGRSRVPL